MRTINSKSIVFAIFLRLSIGYTFLCYLDFKHFKNILQIRLNYLKNLFQISKRSQHSKVICSESERFNVPRQIKNIRDEDENEKLSYTILNED